MGKTFSLLYEPSRKVRGSYLLILQNRKPQRIKVGALGEINFPSGYYLYVGSALNNLEKRIERHKRRRKKRFWHIDYLTTRFQFFHSEVFPSREKVECQIAEVLKQNFPAIPGFGATDCSCLSHLFYSPDEPKIKNLPLTERKFNVLYKMIKKKRRENPSNWLLNEEEI